MLRNSVRLFTIRGIEVGVHASWLVIFALVMALNVLGDALRDALDPRYG